MSRPSDPLGEVRAVPPEGGWAWASVSVDKRELALNAALDFHRDRLSVDGAVIDTAKKFLKFLDGAE